VPPTKEDRRALVPSPKSVVAHLDQFVIRQEVSKRRLALSVSNHFKRAVDTWVADHPSVTDPDLRVVRIEKSNILLIGPSDSEKPHLVRTLASCLNVPSVIRDEPTTHRSRRSSGRVGNDREAAGSGTARSAPAGARCVFSPKVTYTFF
jgi:ATP-dependent Clp protease ATP-binding subunit ClpX